MLLKLLLRLLQMKLRHFEPQRTQLMLRLLLRQMGLEISEVMMLLQLLLRMRKVRRILRMRLRRMHRLMLLQMRLQKQH